MPGTDGSSVAGGHEELTAYRGLAPGWYRDSTNGHLARYWDGERLSEERRPIAPPQSQSVIDQSPQITAPASRTRSPAETGGRSSSDDFSPRDFAVPTGTHETNALAAYRHLAPGWYVAPENPSLARYWDGTSLREGRQPIASPQAQASMQFPSPQPGYQNDESRHLSQPLSPQKIITIVCAIAAVVVAVIAVVYFVVPAHSLPSILGGLNKKLASLPSEKNVHRVRRGEAAAALAAVLLVLTFVLAMVSRRSRTDEDDPGWRRLLGSY